MEAKELVFEMIDRLSYPIVLFQRSETEAWSRRYINEAMQKLLDIKESGEKRSDLSIKHENSLNELITNYDKQNHTDSYTLHNIEIFDAIYSVHMNKNRNNLLIIFIEIPINELFDNITFRDLSKAYSSIIVILDSSGKIVDINECFLNLVLKEKEEVLGENFFEIFMPSYAQKLAPYLEDIVTQDSYSKHFVTPLKDSNAKQYKINWQVSKIVKGKETYIIAVGSDITKFIEENSDLKHQLTSIRVGFDYFPLAVGYMNSSGKFITTNPRFNKIFDIAQTDKKIMFNQVPYLSSHLSFEKIKEYIALIKEMSYYINYDDGKEHIKLKVNIRLLKGKKEHSSLYIVVVQKVKE